MARGFAENAGDADLFLLYGRRAEHRADERALSRTLRLFKHGQDIVFANDQQIMVVDDHFRAGMAGK